MTCRILSLDGGGTWAVLEAMALARLYPNMGGREVLAQFDIAAGNSGGAIVLAALLADMTPDAIVALFRDETSRGRLYVPVEGAEALAAKTGLAPRWSAAGKLAGIMATLGDMGNTALDALGITTRILIPAYEVDTGRAEVYRSRPSPLGAAMPVPVGLAAHASSSAPVVYFDAPADVFGVRMWDGGIGGYNNPVMLAVAEAMSLGETDIVALSIGTAQAWRPLGPPAGGDPATLHSPRVSLGAVGAVKLLATAVIGDPPQAAVVHASAVTRGGVVRLSPSIQPVATARTMPNGPRWALPRGYATIRPDNPMAAFADLVGFDMDVNAQADVETIVALGNAWMADALPNQPIIMDPATGRAVLGAPTWSAAIAQWAGIAHWKHV